jgi:hypothetical protein
VILSAIGVDGDAFRFVYLAIVAIWIAALVYTLKMIRTAASNTD